MGCRPRGRGYSTQGTPTTHPLALGAIAWPSELRRGPQHDDTEMTESKTNHKETQWESLYWQCGVCFGAHFWSSVEDAVETVFASCGAREWVIDSADAATSPWQRPQRTH